ncbi:ketopantoate reductase family protein [Parvibium lacunae]|uniref:2-dehydropantoate 2-reductase n=1 Tax=Parvibium lacunae TaxID=1888893 RepID=A0A368L6A6_9BURK|nr:2-dehydropantoate 2-reductase [Parvibium lacunae]RCS59210.1 2-dehydropantoate 2-reductase [Parvibium lacunae]
MASRKITIIGAGAVGGVIGARLALAGHTVSLLARGAHLAAIQKDGLMFDDVPHDASHVARVTASDNTSTLAAMVGVQDALIIALKAPAIPAILSSLQPLVGPDTVVIPAINGIPWWYPYGQHTATAGSALTTMPPILAVDPDGLALTRLAGQHIIGAVVHFAANMPAPGRVQLSSYQQVILGEPVGGLSDRLSAWQALFNEAGLLCEQTPDIRLALWTKLLGNLSFNPVTALTGYTLVAAASDPGTVGIITSMMQEGIAVAAACGVQIQMSIPERIAIGRGLGPVRTSMLQDMEAARPLETGALIEAVIELGQQHGVPTPTCSLVLALLQAAVLGRQRTRQE